MLSDCMRTLSPGRLALVRRALADAGRYRDVFPADRWENAFPLRWEAGWDGSRAVATFDIDLHHAAVETVESDHAIADA